MVNYYKINTYTYNLHTLMSAIISPTWCSGVRFESWTLYSQKNVIHFISEIRRGFLQQILLLCRPNMVCTGKSVVHQDISMYRLAQDDCNVFTFDIINGFVKFKNVRKTVTVLELIILWKFHLYQLLGKNVHFLEMLFLVFLMCIKMTLQETT